jgi:hypothetical protein
LDSCIALLSDKDIARKRSGIGHLNVLTQPGTSWINPFHEAKVLSQHALVHGEGDEQYSPLGAVCLFSLSATRR